MTTALVLSAATFISGCSGAASATPTVTVTVTAAASSAAPSSDPSTPTPPPGMGVGGTLDAAGIASEQSRQVVISLVRGDKLSAIGAMTPRGAAEVKSRNMKDYLFGGNTVKTCQVGKGLEMQRPNAVDHSNAFETPDAENGADARVSSVEVVCDAGTFGFVVGTVGSLVDGIQYHRLPSSDFTGNYVG
jgi:hypothetical protein